jgi:hypothetical protein
MIYTFLFNSHHSVEYRSSAIAYLGHVVYLDILAFKHVRVTDSTRKGLRKFNTMRPSECSKLMGWKIQISFKELDAIQICQLMFIPFICPFPGFIDTTGTQEHLLPKQRNGGPRSVAIKSLPWLRYSTQCTVICVIFPIMISIMAESARCRIPLTYFSQSKPLDQRVSWS